MRANGGAVKGARSAAIASIAPAFFACGSTPELPPAGQLVLYVDTDAPLAAGDGRPRGALDPAPLFDRLRIDGTNDDGSPCACTREFDVTREMLVARGASFGVLPPLGGGRVRVRLFRGSATVAGEPDPGSTIDATFALPKIPAEGIVERTLLLRTDDVGQPLGVDSPADTITGRPGSSLVGSWPGAQRHDCSAPPADGEVCVPGGAFWMGNVAAAELGAARGDHSRLVVVSPFYVGEQEVTVAAYRRLGGQLSGSWSGQRGCVTEDYCTWTASAGPNEAYPLNCIDWVGARAFCTGQGEDLPTEAQFEYLASGLEGRVFVWGQDPPQCGDAVLERGGRGDFAPYPSLCVPYSSDRTCGGFPIGGLGLGGPAPPGSGARDQLAIALPSWQGTVIDLAGNLSEWTRDAWTKPTDTCWARPGVYVDPECPASPASSLISLRGGDWSGAPSHAMAARRAFVPPRSPGAQLGFRCVRRSP